MSLGWRDVKRQFFLHPILHLGAEMIGGCETKGGCKAPTRPTLCKPMIITMLWLNGKALPLPDAFPPALWFFSSEGANLARGKGKHMLRFGWGGNLHIDILGHHVKSEKEDKDQADIDKTCDITMEKLDPFQFWSDRLWRCHFVHWESV